MSALANRDFVKMNGLGNEIVIVDLRRAPSPISAAEARAAAQREPYDQLMALYPPDGSTDASIRIFNNDGSEAGACGNGMRCVAALVSAETGKAMLEFETTAGLISCWRADGGLFTVDMGRPRWRWDEIPLLHDVADTRAIDLKVPDVPGLQSPSVVSMGNPHANHLAQKFSGRISDRSRPSARSLIPFLAITNPSIPPRHRVERCLQVRDHNVKIMDAGSVTNEVWKCPRLPSPKARNYQQPQDYCGYEQQQ